MRALLTKALFKSLIPFSASLLGPWIQAAFTNNPSSLFYSELHSSFESTTNNKLGPDVLSSQLPFKTVKLTSPMEVVGYSSYFWFMATMMIIEIITFIITRLNLRHSSGKAFTQIEAEQEQQPSNPAHLHSRIGLHQTFAPKLQKFMEYVAKIVILYSLCYFIYMIVYGALHFACNSHITKQESIIAHQDTPFTELEGRVLQEFSLFNETVETEYHIGGERLLSNALSSNNFETLFQTQMTVGAIILSPDHKTAFLARLDSGSDCSLQILDISNRSSPNFLGSVSFEMTYTSKYPWGSSLALVSDKQVILMATGSNLQIIDVSNLTSPIGVSSFSLMKGEIIQSISLSPNNNTVFLATHTTSEESYSYAVKAVNITVTQSPEIMDTILKTGYPLKLFVINETSLSVYTQGFLFTYGNYPNKTQQPTEFSFQTFSESPDVSLVQLDSTFQVVYWAAQMPNASNYRLFYYDLSSDDDSVQYIDLSDTDSTDNVGLTVPESLLISPDGRLLFYNSEMFIQMFDISNLNDLLPLPYMPLSSANCMSISTDEQTLLVGAGGEFYILQLLFNLQPNQVLNTLQTFNNILAESQNPVDLTDKIYQMVLSSDGKTLYMLSPTGVSAFDVSDPSSPQQLSTNFSQVGTHIALSPDDQTLFSVAFSSKSTNFTFYDASDGQLISDFTFDNFGYKPYSNRKTIPSFLITPDGNTAIIIQSSTNFLILDISNPNNISVRSNTSYSALSVISMTLSENGQTLFIAGIDMVTSTSKSSSLRVYDISTPSSPKSISEFDQISGVMASMTLSYNGTIAYILSEPVESVFLNVQDLCILHVINMSSLDTPALITSMNLEDKCGDSQFGPLLSLGSDLQVLPVLLEDFFFYLDVSNPSSPKVMAIDFLPVQCLIASHDFRILYVVTYDALIDTPDQVMQTIIIADVFPQNAIYLSSNNLTLGSPYTSPLNLLTMSSHGTYYSSNFDYKVVDMQLFIPAVDVDGDLQFTNLPNWISLDQTNELLTFSPTSASQVGSYYLYFTFSTQISPETFASDFNNNGGSINQTTASLFLATLMELGYVDDELYVSSKFSPNYWSNIIDTQIVQGITAATFPYANSTEVLLAMETLTSFLITAVTQVTISSSLSLALTASDRFMAINTPSLAPLSLVIILEAYGAQSQFVTSSYSFTASFSNNNSQISMIKSLQDVNTALSQFVVFLNGTDYCNGTIIVVDGLNPTLNQSVFNISQYFFISSPPTINSTYFQNQLAKASPKTSTQFAIQFDTSTFTDPTNQSLTLELQMQDGNQAPGWLELKGYTLTGTAPDQLSGRELALKMIVSNQYQSSEIEFTLDVGISLEYALKLIGTYGGGFITFVGLLVYATHIYNILFKKVYRYPKGFVINIGQEVNPQTLYPIPFVQQPLLESNIIIRKIEHKIKTELQDSSKAKIASYFAIPNSCDLDTEELLNSIQTAAFEVIISDKTKLMLYTSHQKELITELIINHFKLKLLDSDEQKTTKRAFELIKKDLFHLVEFEKVLENRLCKFSVNKALLFAKLKAHNITTFTPLESEDNKTNQSVLSSRTDSSIDIKLDTSLIPLKKSIETELILEDPNAPNADIRNDSSVNMNFLVEILEAYALRQHLVNANIVEVDIVVRTIRKIWGLDSILRFLKLDLRLAGFSGKTIIGYGIEYKVQENLLVFSGAFNYNAKDATLIVQIVNRRGRILRELWLYGVEAEEERRSLVQEIL